MWLVVREESARTISPYSSQAQHPITTTVILLRLFVLFLALTSKDHHQQLQARKQSHEHYGKKVDSEEKAKAIVSFRNESGWKRVDREKFGLTTEIMEAFENGYSEDNARTDGGRRGN
jgi:hypothetical protein